MHSMIAGMFDKERLVDIIHNFIYMPDKSKKRKKLFVILNIMLLENYMKI